MNDFKKDIIITLNHLYKEYDGVLAVEDFNFYIKRGEFVTLLGPSGCGKTTTLRMIAGFEIPTKGEILLDGENITNLPPYKRPVNTVFQKYALFPHLDVYDNVAFGLKLQKIPYQVTDKKGNVITKYRKYKKSEINEKVKKTLKIVDLEEFEYRDVTTLSGGQQQRIAIARALILNPKFLIADEPVSALDASIQAQIINLLKELRQKKDLTILFISHDMNVIKYLADRVGIMYFGELIEENFTKTLFKYPKEEYTKKLLNAVPILKQL